MRDQKVERTKMQQKQSAFCHLLLLYIKGQHMWFYQVYRRSAFIRNVESSACVFQVADTM